MVIKRRNGVKMNLFRIEPDAPDEYEESMEKLWTYGEYVADMVQLPQYRRLFIRLSRMMRITGTIGGNWRSMYREHALAELAEVMASLHEMEAEAERIQDTMLREHVFDWIDSIACMRRSIAEEIRWDLEAAKAGTVPMES
ncbi:hypothetical protein [Methanocella arvoryzae]|nr:hypothetical protein [Methanocella arvoryzae]